MNGLFVAKPPLKPSVLSFASSTASDGLKAPKLRHPAVASTPVGQPANVKLVPFTTWVFHGPLFGLPEVLGLNVMLSRAMVAVPLPEDSFKSPMTVAEAAVIRHNETSVAGTVPR